MAEITQSSINHLLMESIALLFAKEDTNCLMRKLYKNYITTVEIDYFFPIRLQKTKPSIRYYKTVTEL